MNYPTIIKGRIEGLEKKLRDIVHRLDVVLYFSLLLLACIFVLLLLFNNKTFMVADDYIYSFIFTTKESISSFADVIHSQLLHYNLWGGRLVAHTLLQTILRFDPFVIDILNSLMFVCFLLLVSFHIKGRIEFPKLGLLAGIFFAVWIFTPVFAEVALWVTGAVNYLWGTSIILLFLLPYRIYRGTKDLKTLTPLMFLLGIIAGCMNENTSLAMIAMTVLFVAFYKAEYKKMPIWAIAGLLGTLIGYLIMVVAPGNYARAEGVTNEPFVLLYRFLTHTQSFVYQLGGLNLLAFILGVLYIQYGKDKKNVFCYCTIYGVGILISIYAMVLSPSFPPRSWFGPVTFNIILLGILFVNLDGAIKLLWRIKFGLLSFGLITFGFTLYDAVRDVNRIAEEREVRNIEIENAKKSGRVAVVDKCVNRTKFGLGDNPNPYVADYMSAYYGVTIINSDEK